MALSSAALLVCSFPNFNLWWLAWIALVPWLRLVSALTPRRAFGWSWFVGFLFFLGSIWWLVYVTVVGWLILCAYLALFFGLFGWLTSRLLTTHHSLLTIPSSWVMLEYARSHALSGFGWNLLAYSQTPWRAIIQIADVTGAWGVSFLVVLVNVAVASAWGRGARGTGRGRRLVLALSCVLLIVGYGRWRVPQVVGAAHVRIAVVQGNIPQEEKWDAAHVGAILDRYETLTRAAAAAHPQLIVWPETSVPGFFGLDEAVTQRVLALSKSVRAPLLVGAPMGRTDLAGWRDLNSAALLEDGALTQHYDKLHLVPLGEFVPFERTLPWLRRLLPPIGDFTPGNQYTIFRVPVESLELRVQRSNSQLSTHNSQLSFSVLICFEDVFPELARRFVRDGARLLLVITNDAWFGPTAAAYQHAQASTLRAVELRVPVARAANTGWSGCLDAAGAWRERVHDTAGRELFIPGAVTCDLPAGIADSRYLRWGDWFVALCALLLLLRLPYNKRF